MFLQNLQEERKKTLRVRGEKFVVEKQRKYGMMI
jgi:hypothetical protein